MQISTCSGFQTLAHAETKNTAGLRCTGIAMCICSRHEFVRPNGVGDLQKGERYVIVLSVLYASDDISLDTATSIGWFSARFCLSSSPGFSSHTT